MKSAGEEGGIPASQGRFYVERLPAEGETVEILGAEAAHAAGSRRIRIGEIVTLFDGSGWDVKAEVVSAEKRTITLRRLSRAFVGRPFPVPVTCATALPKGAREDVLVSKCAELGVTRLAPLEFERSVVKPSVHWETRRERFVRLAVEAAKQSGASTVMDVAPPVSFADFVKEPLAGLGVVGVPKADASLIDVLQARWAFDALTYVVGPEGDLTPAEIDAALAAGFVGVTIAPTVLRVETAAIAFASLAAAFLAAKKERGAP